MKFYSNTVRSFVEDESGQAATEYMMVVSVMVVAVISATRAFYDPMGPFLTAWREFSRNVGTIVADDSSPILPGPSGNFR